MRGRHVGGPPTPVTTEGATPAAARRCRAQRCPLRPVNSPVCRGLDPTAPVAAASRSRRTVAVGVGGRGGRGVGSPSGLVGTPRSSEWTALESGAPPALLTCPTRSKENGRSMRPMGLRHRYRTYQGNPRRTLYTDHCGENRRGRTVPPWQVWLTRLEWRKDQTRRRRRDTLCRWGGLRG